MSNYIGRKATKLEKAIHITATVALDLDKISSRVKNRAAKALETGVMDALNGQAVELFRNLYSPTDRTCYIAITSGSYTCQQAPTGGQGRSSSGTNSTPLRCLPVENPVNGYTISLMTADPFSTATAVCRPRSSCDIPLKSLAGRWAMSVRPSG